MNAARGADAAIARGAMRDALLIAVLAIFDVNLNAMLISV